MKRVSLVFASLLLSGCLVSPLGTNSSTDAYPVPENDKVVVFYHAPSDVTGKLIFQLEAEEGKDPVVKEDDSPDDGYGVEFDTKGFAPGVYFVSVFLDGSDESLAQIPFIVPDPEAAGEPEAES